MITREKAISNIKIKDATLGQKHTAPLSLHPFPVVGVITEGNITFQIEDEPVQHPKAAGKFNESANMRIARFDND